MSASALEGFSVRPKRDSGPRDHQTKTCETLSLSTLYPKVVNALKFPAPLSYLSANSESLFSRGGLHDGLDANSGKRTTTRQTSEGGRP